MTDASWTDVPPIARAPETRVPLSAPVPFDAPVLIADAATPLADETLLSLLWKRLDDRG